MEIVDATRGEILSADNTSLQFSNFSFDISLIRNVNNEKGEAEQSIIFLKWRMPPMQAKLLLITLGEAVKLYEEKITPIHVPQAMLHQMGIE